MLTRQRCITILLLAAVAIRPAIAQDAQQRVDPAATPSVTAAASGGDLRFTAPGAVVQIRLEIFSPEGEKVFDSGDKPGNVLDWRTQEQKAALHAEASYLCTVTVRDLSNRLSQRHGLIALSGDRITLRTAERDHLTPAQVQAREANRLAQSLVAQAADDELTILAADTVPALMVTTHDGRDGHVTSTAGALTLRTGDIFAGKEREQMRITPAGQVGIGTTTPEATLDVAGTLRARGGIEFDDGTVLTSAGRAARAGTTGEDTLQPLVAGTGTTNRVTKWTDGPAGTLGDSALTEAGGKLGLGTPNPNFELTLFGSNVGVQLISPGTGAASGDGFRFGIDRTNSAFLFNQEATDMYFGTKATERMRITSSGNVGIGTSSPNPATMLDVAGDINTSTQYRIGGARVFSIPGSNTFAGLDAGPANTTGTFNSFFGFLAGFSNTTASNNSFFGFASGVSNTTGDSNSFFGAGAGASHTTGDSNSFFGTEAGIRNTTGAENSFFGTSVGLFNTTGQRNSFFGERAGEANTTGGGNSFFGRKAGNANTSGDNNIVIGISAGANLTTGNNNIYLGSSPGANESNTIRIGTQGTQTTAFIAGISGNVSAASGTAVFVDANGRLGTILSSRRFKQNIRAMGNASGKLMQLRPVTFLYKPEVVPGEQTLQYGLIAEEVAKIYPDLVQYAADGQPQTVRYHLLNTMLLNEVQKQQSHIQSQAHQIQAQTQRITNQALQLQTQTQQMTQQAQQISSLETRLRRIETGASRRQKVRRR